MFLEGIQQKTVYFNRMGIEEMNVTRKIRKLFVSN